MKKIFYFLVLVLLLSTLMQAEKIAEFDLLMGGKVGLTLNTRYYVLFGYESGIVMLYDRKNLKKTVEFGKIGEGPGEFIQTINDISDGEDRLYISSSSRLSCFDLNGKLIAEIKLEMFDHVFGVAGKNLLVRRPVFSSNHKQNGLMTILMNPDMKEIKTLYIEETQFSSQNRYKIEPLKTGIVMDYDNHHIIVADPNGDGVITVYDTEGQLLSTIHHPFEKIPVTAEDRERTKKRIMVSWERNPRMKARKDEMNIIFPKYYPPFQRALLHGNSILVTTNKKNPDFIEILCFDIAGTYKGIAKQSKDTFVYYPFQGHFYLLKENEETEMYELHRWPVAELQKQRNSTAP